MDGRINNTCGVVFYGDEDLDIALLPVGSTECHGPHLPVESDWIVAEELCKRVKKKLDAAGIAADVLPPVKVSPSHAASESPGTVMIEPRDFQENVFNVAAK